MALEQIIFWKLVEVLVKASIQAAAGEKGLVSELLAASGPGVVDRLKQGTPKRVLQELHRGIELSLKALIGEVQGEEGALDASTFALEQTFSAENLSAGRLVDGSLNAETLAAELIPKSKPHTRFLSEWSRNAVERALGELAEKICLAAPQLEHFDALAWKGAYRRLDSLLAATSRILSVLPAEDEDRRFEYRYRGYLAEELDELRLFGIDVPDECERYPLSVAYVHLHAEASGAGRPEPVAEVLGPMKRVMIRGVAGSGKTTLLQWLAVRAATNDLPPEMAGWGAPVPFFLKLRSFVRRQDGKLSLDLPNPADWVQCGTDNRFPRPPDGWVDRLFDQGRALILLDGVDEVPSELWRDVRDWIRSLCLNDLAGRCRIVVSARLQLAEDWLSGNDLGFESRTLAPFSLHDAEVLIHKWYEAIAPAMRAGKERDELSAEAAALIGEVTVIAPLRRLVDTPLLGAMICAVYRKDRSLPRSRADLYERTTKALILRRDRS